jgi:hypothetical protein
MQLPLASLKPDFCLLGTNQTILVYQIGLKRHLPSGMMTAWFLAPMLHWTRLPVILPLRKASLESLEDSFKHGKSYLS